MQETQRVTEECSLIRYYKNNLHVILFSISLFICFCVFLIQFYILQLLSNFCIDADEEVNMILKLVPVPEQPIHLKVTKRL